MKQKTLYTDKHLSVGDEVLLIGRQRPGEKEIYTVSKEMAKNGYPGNMDRNIYRYHGWRGETNGTSIYAYGVRKVECVETTDKRNEVDEPIYKIRVGKDIHPEYK